MQMVKYAKLSHKLHIIDKEYYNFIIPLNLCRIIDTQLNVLVTVIIQEK